MYLYFCCFCLSRLTSEFKYDELSHVEQTLSVDLESIWNGKKKLNVFFHFTLLIVEIRAFSSLHVELLQFFIFIYFFWFILQMI